MLTHSINEIIVFAPFVLSQNNWSLDSGKTNGVIPAHVMRHVRPPRTFFESEYEHSVFERAS
jgi:hypothetical protein